MPTFLARTAAAAAFASLFAIAPAFAAAPTYKLVIFDGTSAVVDVASHGWSVSDVKLEPADQRCKRQACSPVPALPNDMGLTGTMAFAVNNLGQVAGESPAAKGTVRHAILFDGAQTIDLGVFDNDDCGGCTLNSFATDLNDRRQVVGVGTVGDGSHRQAFLWQDGVFKGLGTLGGLDSYASAINRKGHVVGSAQRADGYTHAFLYRNGRMQDLGTLGNDVSSDATGINDAGQICGNSSRLGSYRAFVYQDGVKKKVPLLPDAEWNVAIDINNHGWVVGLSIVAGAQQGWVFDGEAAYNLNAVLSNFDPRYRIQAGRGIADNGQIAVEVLDNERREVVGGLLVPVTPLARPEWP